jgi:large repetitive protein
LPPGLSLNSLTGEVSGTSTTVGTYNFIVQATDANSQTDTQALTIVVNSAPIITTTSLPNATVSGPYSQTLVSAGGTVPLTWNVISGSLPAGMTLSSSGVLLGTPTTAGTSSFTVRVTDTNSVSASQALSLIVNPAPTITRTNLPDIKVNHSYSQTVTASGGTTPLVWSISAGSLPPGLSLNSSNGLISGTPTAIATYNFSVSITDANSVNTSQALSIKVKP